MEQIRKINFKNFKIQNNKFIIDIDDGIKIIELAEITENDNFKFIPVTKEWYLDEILKNIMEQKFKSKTYEELKDLLFCVYETDELERDVIFISKNNFYKYIALSQDEVCIESIIKKYLYN